MTECGRLLVKNRESRTCQRCGRPLTDPASLNEGVGPVCRNLDNHLLAQLLDSDFDAALKCYRNVSEARLHSGTIEDFRALGESLLRKAATTARDLRLEAKLTERILSFEQAEANARELTSLVEALGYVGLANLWRGEATISLAAVSFEKGRLYLFASRSKAGAQALKQIPGWRFHPEGAEGPRSKAGWSFPPEQAEAFASAVGRHYPVHEGMEEAVRLAKASIPLRRPSPRRLAMEDFGTYLALQIPYNPDFIAAIKELPVADRQWNPRRKEWEIAGRHRDHVLELLARHFSS